MTSTHAYAESPIKLPKYDVEIAERKDTPGVWTVEAINEDGGIEQALFVGPKAHERAEAYSRFQYGA